MNPQGATLVSSVAATVALPALFLRAAFDPRWAYSLRERLGFGGWSGCIRKDSERPIWLHAASVGEVIGVSPLLSRLKDRIGSGALLVTTTSLTGREEARRRQAASEVFLLPLDHPLVLNWVLDRVRPRLVIIAETEIWPGFLLALKRRSVPVVLVNGRISDRSYPWYLRFRGFFAPVLAAFSRVFVQSALDADRFSALGVVRDRIRVTGSTKYDRGPSVEDGISRETVRGALGLAVDAPVLVAGSVRSGEFGAVIDAYLALRIVHPSLQLVLAPRHPERFSLAGEELEKRKVAFRRRSEHSEQKAASLSPVLLLDTLGELHRAYAAADIAFVGGTLVPVGGHNVLEPAAFGVPVLVGPHTENVREISELLRHRGGMVVVRTSAELAAAVGRLLSDSTYAEGVGRAAYGVWNECRGATSIVLEELEPYLGVQKLTGSSRCARA